MFFKKLKFTIGKTSSQLAWFISFLFFCGLNWAQEPSTTKLRNKIEVLKRQKKDFHKDTTYIGLLNDLSIKLRFTNPDSLLFLATEAHDLSTNLGFIKGEMEALQNLGCYYSDKGQHKTAIENYENALKFPQKDNYPNLILRISNDLSNEHVYNGDYSTALMGYLENIKLAQKLNNKKMESILYENIASLYATQKDYEQALYFYSKVEKINVFIADDVNSAETMSNVASIHAETGDFQNALFKLNRSIKIFEQNKVLDWLAFAYEVKGKVYLLQKQYTRALYWYNKSMVLHENLQDDRGIIDLYNAWQKLILPLKEIVLPMILL